MITPREPVSWEGRPSCPNHICSWYRGCRERDDCIRRYVRDGLGKGERVLCLAVGDRRRLRDLCLAAGPDGATLEPSRKQLEFLEPRKIYMPGGSFDADHVLDLLASGIRHALDLGFEGLRVVSDVGWIRETPPGIHQVVEYENRVNAVTRGLPCTVLCLFPREALSRSFLVYMLLAHPYLLRGTTLQFNPCYEKYELLMNAATAGEVYHKILNNLQPVP